jgi:DNA-binding MarR family transcriptional regulator
MPARNREYTRRTGEGPRVGSLQGLTLHPPVLYSAAMNDSPCPFLVSLLRSLYEVEERVENDLEKVGLSLAKYRLLAELAEQPEPLPLSTLAERCACVRSNITQLVDRLEGEKLVMRTDDPRDRRSVRAELTAEGRQRHQAGLAVLQAVERDLMAPLSPPQQASLLEQLTVVRGTL